MLKTHKLRTTTLEELKGRSMHSAQSCAGEIKAESSIRHFLKDGAEHCQLRGQDVNDRLGGGEWDGQILKKFKWFSIARLGCGVWDPEVGL